MKTLNKIGILLITVLLSFASCEVIEAPYLVGAEEAKDILEFSVGDVYGVIDLDFRTVTLDFPEGTDVSHLAPTIVVSNYATVSPASGVAQDFTQPVIYAVTAYDGSSVDYQVTAVVHDAENEKSILSFRLEDLGCDGVISEYLKTVSLVLPEGTDVTHLVPTIEVSEGATVSPASGEAQDFTNPVDYTVTAINGTTAVYAVSVTFAGSLEPTGKTVLLHDYTGSRCVNCPPASDLAHQLQHEYDGRLIVMSVHAGGLATPVGNFPDFLTEEGTAWYNGNSANPLGSVNHVKLLSGYTLQSSSWTDAVANAFLEPQTIEMRVSNAYNPSNRQLTTTIEALELAPLGDNLAITVCLIEDNIVGQQITPTGLVTDYVHRNVFRKTFNGTYGETMFFDQDGYYTNSFNLILSEEYNADNCYVVAYIYDTDPGSMKIHQTAVQKVD